MGSRLFRAVFSRYAASVPRDARIFCSQFTKDQTISCIGQEALQAVTSGVITPNEAGQIASLIGANARLIALTELNQRMNAFEENKG